MKGFTLIEITIVLFIQNKKHADYIHTPFKLFFISYQFILCN
ncbi:type II secretion system protein [Ligilactobacillus salivarius]